MNQEQPEQEQVLLIKIPTNRGRRLARSPGHSPKLPNGGEPQLLTDTKFMSRAQRAAHADGVEIWV
jgi:hypothetical protein